MVWTPITPRYDPITPRRELQSALRKGHARTETDGAVFESTVDNSVADITWDQKLMTPRVDTMNITPLGSGVFEKEATTSVADAHWDSKLFTPRPGMHSRGCEVDAWDAKLFTPRTDTPHSVLDTTGIGFSAGLLSTGPLPTTPTTDAFVSTRCFTPRTGSGTALNIPETVLSGRPSPILSATPPSPSDVEWDAGLAMPLADGLAETGELAPKTQQAPHMPRGITGIAGMQPLSLSSLRRGSTDSTAEDLLDEGRGSLPIKATPRPSVPRICAPPSGLPAVAEVPRGTAEPPDPVTVTRSSIADAHMKQLEVLSAQLEEFKQRMDREVREKSSWERRALDAEATNTRLATDLEQAIARRGESATQPAEVNLKAQLAAARHSLDHARQEVNLKAQLAAARHSLDHARQEAAQAREDADLAWHQVDAARNDAALIQETLLGCGLGGEAASNDGMKEQLEAKDQEIAKLKEANRILLAAKEEAAKAQAPTPDTALAEMAKLREDKDRIRSERDAVLEENARLRNELDAALEVAGNNSSDTAKGNKVAQAEQIALENKQLHGYLVNMQKLLFELEQAAGKSESERVREMERQSLDAKRKISKMNGFIERFLYKAHRPLSSMQSAFKTMGKAPTGATAPVAPPLLFELNSTDMPNSMVNVLCQLRYFASVLGSASNLPEA